MQAGAVEQIAVDIILASAGIVVEQGTVGQQIGGFFDASLVAFLQIGNGGRFFTRLVEANPIPIVEAGILGLLFQLLLEYGAGGFVVAGQKQLAGLAQGLGEQAEGGTKATD